MNFESKEHCLPGEVSPNCPTTQESRLKVCHQTFRAQQPSCVIDEVAGVQVSIDIIEIALLVVHVRRHGEVHSNGRACKLQSF